MVDNWLLVVSAWGEKAFCQDDTIARSPILIQHDSLFFMIPINVTCTGGKKHVQLLFFDTQSEEKIFSLGWEDNNPFGSSQWPLKEKNMFLFKKKTCFTTGVLKQWLKPFSALVGAPPPKPKNLGLFWVPQSTKFWVDPPKPKTQPRHQLEVSLQIAHLVEMYFGGREMSAFSAPHLCWFRPEKNSHSFGALNLQPSTLQPPTPYLAGGGCFAQKPVGHSRSATPGEGGQHLSKGLLSAQESKPSPPACSVSLGVEHARSPFKQLGQLVLHWLEDALGHIVENVACTGNPPCIWAHRLQNVLECLLQDGSGICRNHTFAYLWAFLGGENLTQMRRRPSTKSHALSGCRWRPLPTPNVPRPSLAPCNPVVYWQWRTPFRTPPEGCWSRRALGCQSIHPCQPTPSSEKPSCG